MPQCAARDRLGDGLISAYAVGTLAHGGFRTAVSDVDLALLTDDQHGRNMPQIEARIAAEGKTAGHQLADNGVTIHDATKIVLWAVRLQRVCDTGQATGNAAAVDHYLQLPDARHRSLAHDALDRRDLTPKTPAHHSNGSPPRSTI
jgi:hypothetical protein